MSRPIKLFGGWLMVLKYGICTFGAGWYNETKEVYLVCLGFFAIIFAKCDYNSFLAEWKKDQ